MLLMTFHKTVVGTDANGELVQIGPGMNGDATPLNVQLTDLNTVLRSGSMAGVAMSSDGPIVRLVKQDLFVAAEPGNPMLVANRAAAGVWESYTLVSDDHLELSRSFPLTATEEVNRFARRVRELCSSGTPVKLYIGCGLVPRTGFLNLDITVMAPEFARHHPDDYFIFPYADIPWGIPDASVDYVFHEDFIEHISQLQQFLFLAEALRVLKPGCYHRVNTPNLITAMRDNSDFEKGMAGVYTVESVRWGHISLFSPASLKEMALLVGYREVVFTTRHHGVSKFAEIDTRPGLDRDDIVGNIYADLQR